MRRTFVLGDVHGAHKALVQVLKKSRLDPENDRLICLGDISDRNPGVVECFDEIMKIKDLVYILGNHDWWLLQWFIQESTPEVWIKQGGDASMASYERLTSEQKQQTINRHRGLLERALYYYQDPEKRLFVHGGFDHHLPIDLQTLAHGEFSEYTWNRSLIKTALSWHRQNLSNSKEQKQSPLRFEEYEEIFIGHTSTQRIDPALRPVQLTNLWALDQGAGWEGKLTLMDVDTHEYWQSDPVEELYPVIG